MLVVAIGAAATSAQTATWRADKVETLSSDDIDYYWLGDMDLNDKIDCDDISVFLFWLTHRPDPNIIEPWIPYQVGDCDQNGRMDHHDIDDFVRILVNGEHHKSIAPKQPSPLVIAEGSPIPEPTTLSLVAVGALTLIRRKRK